MNWQIESRASDLDDAPIDVTYSSSEDQTIQPDPDLLTDARQAATALAGHLGGAVAVTILGHETTGGDEFRTAHVSITASRLAS